MDLTNRKELPDLLANKARKMAYKQKVATNTILQPLLIEHGFEDGSGMNLETYCITLSYNEDLDKVPTKEIMEVFGLIKGGK
jgi:hypothetical protein